MCSSCSEEQLKTSNYQYVSNVSIHRSSAEEVLEKGSTIKWLADLNWDGEISRDGVGEYV